MSEVFKEACVETLEQARLAERCGAGRVELCASLNVGGLTPADGLISQTVGTLRIPVMVMVRPRAGDFVASETEFEAMKRTIDFCKNVNATGVVFGLLTQENEVDIERTATLAQMAQPLQVTFHKAIDETRDILKAVAALKSIGGVTRILSSGGAATALRGVPILRQMISAAGPELTVIAAGRITKDNLPKVHQAIGAPEYHGRRIVF
ncbi:MAG: copper homeostasis protein CutC [Saprospiraceae bacterium]